VVVWWCPRLVVGGGLVVSPSGGVPVW